MTQKHVPTVGISFTLAAFLILSLFSALNKYVQEIGFPTSQVMFFDGMVGALCMVAVSWQQKDLRGLRMKNLPMQFLLMSINVLAGYCYFKAYPHLPLVTAYLIGFMGPMLITLLSAIFLKEKIYWQQGVALVVGFAAVAYSLLAKDEGGTSILLNPEKLPAILHMAAGMVLFCIAQVMVRKLSNTESIWSFPFYFYIGMFAVSSLFFSSEFVMPHTARDWTLLLLLGVFDASSLAMLYLSLKYARAATVVPFQYSGIIWMGIIDLVVWNKPPAFSQIIGAGVLVLAGIYLATFERKQSRKKKKAE